MCRHWDWLLKDITGGEVDDVHGLEEADGYGLNNVYHDLDKKYAALNADSYVFLPPTFSICKMNRYEFLLNSDRYAWYATEVLWSVLCEKSYEGPSDDDSDSHGA